MLIIQIILIIIAIAAVIGVFALILDLRSQAEYKPYGPYERFIKRPLDAFLASGALIVLSPILAIIALLVRIKLGPPVLLHKSDRERTKKTLKSISFAL